MTTTDNREDEKLYSEIINQNSDVLLQLINDILDLSKIEAGTFEYIKQPMDLGEMCRNVYEIHKGRVQEGVTLTLDNENDSLMINEDKNRILQLITNLITNAIKFTYEGEIHFGFKLKKDYIDFYVKDTGIGISEEKLSHIFGRFVKLNSFVQGTGLGLAICQMIVEKMVFYMATKSANLYARIEPDVKEKAESILSTLGIPASSAINMFYKQIILQRGLPFEVKIPSDRPVDISTLSEAEFNEELEKGYADMQAGRTKNAKKAFADIRKDYGL